MTKKIIFIYIIILIAPIGKLTAQKIDGIWLSKYSIKINKEKEENRYDSIYFGTYAILDFITNKNVIIKPIGKRQILGTYKIENNDLELTVDNQILNGTINNHHLVTFEETENEIFKTFFEKIESSNISPAKFPDSLSISKTFWELQIKSDLGNYALKYHFLDSKNILITKNTGLYGFTDYGKFIIDSYKNHYFIEISNKVTDFVTVCHLFKTEKKYFLGDIIQYDNFKTKLPYQTKLKLIKKEFLSSESKAAIESNLIGKWKAINNQTLFDSISSDFQKIENQSFQLIFKKNNQFESFKKGVLINENGKNLKEIVQTGNWKLSSTGEYIEIYQKGKSVDYITIKGISENELGIYYNFRTIDGNVRYNSNRLIKLIK